MSTQFRYWLSLKTALSAGVLAVALTAAPIMAVDAEPGQGSGGQQTKGAQGAGGPSGGEIGGRGGKSLNAIFRDVTGVSDDGEDSDRPEWAGVPGGKDSAGGGQPDTSGSKKGDLYGDLWIILRDDNGVPILTSEGWVQPLDAEGNPIPLDEEGHPVDDTLTLEVELGRLNVGRAPTSVLDRRADEVIALLNAATEVSLDPAGRLILTVDGEQSTIDSPLENLALYVALLTDGSIPGVTNLPGTAFDFMVDGVYTVEDLDAAKAFLAAATDKTGAFTPDEIAYIDSFLGINIQTTGDVTYSVVDYSAFTYDRSDAYAGVTTTVLILQPDGSWLPTEIDVYDEVFGSVDVTAAGSLEAYTQAADDSRTVINFIHEFAVPELEEVVSQ